MHVSSMISTSFTTRTGCPGNQAAYFDQATAVGFTCLSSHVIKTMCSIVVILEITAQWNCWFKDLVLLIDCLNGQMERSN